MIKSYELLKIIQFLEEHGIKNYSINEDGIVDVDGNVDLSDKNLTSIPVQFGKVGGAFYCSRNHLTTLEGAPRSVGGWFGCSHNQLTTLKGAPQSVRRAFYCRNNKKKFTEQEVRELREVGGSIYC